MDVSGWIKTLLTTLQRWRETSRGRRELRQLSDDILKDIGVSRADAERVAARPFWEERPVEDATLMRYQAAPAERGSQPRCASRA